MQLVPRNKLRGERERHAYIKERSKHDPADAQLEARPSLNQVDKSCRDWQTRRLLNPTALCKTCCLPKPTLWTCACHGADHTVLVYEYNMNLYGCRIHSSQTASKA